MNAAQSAVITREAVDLTYRTVHYRWMSYRWLFILVGLTLFLSLATALVLLQATMLAGLALAIAWTGIYWCIDATRVSHWQQQLFERWQAGVLNLDVFAETLAAMPELPRNVVASMLATLPTRRNGFTDTPPALRRSVAETIDMLNRCRRDQTAVVTATYTLAAWSLVLALTSWSWRPLLLLTGIVLAWVVYWILQHLRTHRWKRSVAAYQAQWDTTQRRTFLRIIDKLNWVPIRPRARQRMIQDITNAVADGHEEPLEIAT